MLKKFLKLCSFVLTIVLLVNMLPMQIYALELEATDTVKPVTGQTSQEITVLGELTEKRTEYTKEFRLSNGLNLATVYAEPVHYQEDGQWKEIDNTLVSTTAGFRNTAGVWDVTFPQNMRGNNAVTIQKDGHTLSFYMSGKLQMQDGAVVASADGAETFALQPATEANAQVQKIDLSQELEQAQYPETVATKSHSRLQYSGVFANTNVVYDLAANQVKESIIIGQADASLRGYRYALNTGDMIPVLEDSGQITLYDKDKKKVVMVMPAPYLLDAAGEYSGDVAVSLTGAQGVYTLTYTLPQSWMTDTNRQYPVVLDPVVRADLDPNNIRDRTVGSEQDMGQEDGSLRCGWQKYFGALRTYIKYTELPSLSSADVIVGATMSLYSMATNTSTYPISVHKVLGTWESETITYKTAPAFDPAVEDYAYVPGQGLYYWDVTDLVRDWYSGTNTGMMFKAPASIENSTSTNIKKFYSSDYSIYQTVEKPTLLIYFRNNNGLEGYWDYTTASAGRAGTGYINDYTGNLVWVRGDIGFGGNRMPVTINHVYNANDSQSKDFGMGYGWRTNFNQLVYLWDEDSNYYVWEDGDGTKHYFLKDTSENNYTYKDEDGLELTLTTNGSGTEKYRLKDKGGNTSYFDTNGRLTKQENNQQTTSSITVTYSDSTGKRISTVTDGAGRIYSFTYTSDLLSRIGYWGSGSRELSYVEFGYTGLQLTSVTDKDGKSSTYTYGANNLLTSAQDIDGYKLAYTYNTTTAGQPSRVATVKEYDGSTLGGELTIEYAHNQTTFTDHNGNQQILQFNNWGNTVSVQDGEGRAQYGRYATDTSSSAKGNQLTFSSKLQNTVSSLLSDSSFENGTAWTLLSGNATASVVASSTSTPAYLGNKLLRVTGSAAGAAVSGGTFSAAAGESYTFSAFVRTDSTASAYLAMTDGAATVRSDTLAPGSGWTRLEVAYTNSAATAKTVTVQLVVETAGTVYADCAQVENAPTASRYNIIQNGDFRSGTANWTASADCGSTETCATADSAAAPQLETTVFQMTGDPARQLHICQTVSISGSAGDCFVLSGWAMGDSVPLTGTEAQERTFSLRGVFVNTDNTETPFTFHFNPDVPDTWQYTSGAMVADKPYSSIKIYCLYDYNANTVCFDGIQLYKEVFGSSYTYDEDGNVVSVKDLQQQTTTYEYDANDNLTGVNLPTGAKLTYTYDDYHNVLTATTEEGAQYTFSYDAWGNNTGVSIGGKISSTATYSSDGNTLVSTTDALGKTTLYGYNADTNTLDWVQYPEDTAATRTNYTYDSMYRMASAAVTTDTGLNLSAAYTYTDDYLTKITTASTTYDFTYGDFGLRTAVKIGNRTLAGYTYTDDANNYLQRLDYGNGDSVQYEYDDQGRVTRQTYEDNSYVTYAYDNSGALATVYDSKSGITSTYYYDLTDRMVKVTEKGDHYSHSIGYEYDTINNLTQVVETVNGVAHTTSYAYDLDNRVTEITTDGVTKTYTYDTYGRVSQQVTTSGGVPILTETYTYTPASDGQLSAQVATYRTQSALYDVTYAYTYDGNGNILSVSDGTNTTSYVYDSANQLIRENDQAANKTTTWAYDNAGNILQRDEYTYTTAENPGTPTDTVNYAYGETPWRDLLTAYDDQAITYDAIGNPTRDYAGNTYTWQQGRELASMSGNGVTWNYTYDADGMRTSRTNGTATYRYIYSGSKLLQMEISDTSTGAVSHTLGFTYDAQGTPQTVTYNGTVYYYATNLQGDIVAILNASGTTVVEYTYDAWGNPLSLIGSLASTLGKHNPLRYRGYVYDQETGFYYLQSRYYDPTTCRFINADAYASTGQGIIGHNMFAYCGNNSVCYFDPTGTTEQLYADPVATYLGDTQPVGAGAGAVILIPVYLGTAIGFSLTAAVKSLWESISKSYARTTERSYTSPEEVHHIVAKRSIHAAPAALILNSILPGGVENPVNKISIKTGLHRRLHSYLYYSMVNSTVIAAFCNSSNPVQQQANVVSALGILRGILEILNALAPY